MKVETLHTSYFFLVATGFILVLSVASALSQSQALNGQIEGTVSDQNNAAVPNAVITVTNIEAGATRNALTDQRGVYRFPLLPLGTYRITAEAAYFKKFVREGITLATGQTATVDIELAAGEVRETVTVSSDTSIADPGKTDLGRVLKTREVQNLPIFHRNAYSLGILQANVTGRPRRSFEAPTINANGYSRRINYLLDGNRNSQTNLPGVRLMAVSEIYVNEIQLVTNGFAAEFGNTPGMIFNVVTPSGSNTLTGSVGYRFAHTPFYSRPFFYGSSDDLPKNIISDLTATIGGAIIKDRWHFYAGYESVYRDDNAGRDNQVTILPSDSAQLIAAGLPASIFPASIPIVNKRSFYIFRTDVQLNERHRLTGRFNRSPQSGRNVAAGGLNTLERSIDITSPDHSLGTQLVSYGRVVLNELRFQYAQRTQRSEGNELSGSGPSIEIQGVANFGPVNAGPGRTMEKATQVQDNLTWTIGTHIVKLGGGVDLIDVFRRSATFSRYIFPSIAAYLNARNGGNPRSYTLYQETFGDPEISYKSSFWNFFLQDDWKRTRRLKINYGFRYDFYRIPKADPNSPFAASQRFKTDKNNLAPRLGVAFALREGGRSTVVRFGAGIYYETPWLNIYDRALLSNGNPRFFNLSFTPAAMNAPAFPNTFSSSIPPGSTLPPQNIDAVAPDFVNMYAIHSNVQLEQALSENYSFAVGYVHSAGRHIPIYRNINCLPTGGTLADGRPLFGPPTLPISPCTNRIFPQFRNIQMVESAGVSRYDALNLQLTKRFSRGLQFSALYTLSKATGDAHDIFQEGWALSDPTNRALDNGDSSSDQRHTFVMSMVARPQFRSESKTLHYLLNNNQVGFIVTANSGETFNIISGLDVNRDGLSTHDRPVGIKRNSGRTPPQYNVDLRYSRFLNFTKDRRLEVFGEFQNLFNINSIIQFNNVRVATDASTGELIGGLPDFKARNQSTAQESRQLQLGVKFIF